MELPDMSQWMLTEKHVINIHRKNNYRTIIKYLLCNYIERVCGGKVHNEPASGSFKADGYHKR